jgi:hypothetical protein
LLRVLSLYIIVNDKHLYQLKEGQPLTIEAIDLPVKLVAENGFHFSKPMYIRQNTGAPVLVGIGCEADNGRLWGGIMISALFFIIFFATGLYVLLLPANLPLIYLVYKIFWKPKQFITIEILKK